MFFIFYRLYIIQSYYNITDYIPHVIHYISETVPFITGSFYLVISLTNFALSFSPPDGDHWFVLCICESVSVLLYLLISFVLLDSPYKWKPQYLSLIYFTKCKMPPAPPRSILVVTNDKISFFLADIPGCVCVYHMFFL